MSESFHYNVMITHSNYSLRNRIRLSSLKPRGEGREEILKKDPVKITLIHFPPIWDFYKIKNQSGRNQNTPLI